MQLLEIQQFKGQCLHCCAHWSSYLVTVLWLFWFGSDFLFKGQLMQEYVCLLFEAAGSSLETNEPTFALLHSFYLVVEDTVIT